MFHRGVLHVSQCYKIVENMIERALKGRISEALRYAPLVWLTGVRGVGKKILAGRYMLKSFDLMDAKVAEAAKRDPKGFVATCPDRSLLAHIEAAPFLLPALDWSLQTLNLPARFIVTSSSYPNLDQYTTLARMPKFQLYPLAQSELEQSGNIVDLLFSQELPLAQPFDNDYSLRIVQGGFPEALVGERRERDLFFETYLEAFLANLQIESHLPRPSLFRKLLTHLAQTCGKVLNQSALAKTLGTEPMTLYRYLKRLESLSVITAVPGFELSTGRFVKSPRVHIFDTGLTCSLLNLGLTSLQNSAEHYQRLLGSFAVLELQKQLAWSKTVATLHHVTTYGGRGVDIVLKNERGGVVALQIRGSEKLEHSDFTDLKRLRSRMGERFLRGVVLHTGTEVMSVDQTLSAIPLSVLYQSGIMKEV
jgi:uncharacterized protein